jgi:hypothetical protein
MYNLHMLGGALLSCKFGYKYSNYAENENCARDRYYDFQNKWWAIYLANHEGRKSGNEPSRITNEGEHFKLYYIM